MDLFEYNLQLNREKNLPLSARMRPESIEDYIGQDHIVGEGKFLNRLIVSDKIPSMIFYGPPGTGKTTLARIISNQTNSLFETLSAVTCNIKDLRQTIDLAEKNLKNYSKKTILFIDEIHAFNKKQQDALLPYVEDGTIIFIGATTENPYFEVNKALLSRCQVIKLNSLSRDDIVKILKRAIETDDILKQKDIQIKEESLEFLADISNGDARTALNTLEISVLSSSSEDRITIDNEKIRNSISSPIYRYDRADEHYNVTSAFIKSMRGSDIDAALHYLSRMIISGEDPKFIARRMIIFASEDVGLADSNALNVAINVFNAVTYVGMPEAYLNLAHGVIYLANAPKSNSVYTSIQKAMKDVKDNKNFDVPDSLKDSHYKGASELGYGIDYKNPHKTLEKQAYLPDKLTGVRYFIPKDIGDESIIYNKFNYNDTSKEKR
ncbi:MAG: replication-associated recombination protein A [Finegoldia sp.]|nr:replication-associated recombination protein A [Finegoldia sp.]